MNDEISIIIPTLGRSAQLDALLRSIARSTHANYEVVVVDQNRPRIVDDILAKYESLMRLVHLKVDFAGAARARNIGCASARGEYLFFPDDDCELRADTLAGFLECRERTGADVVFGRCVDRSAADSVGAFSREAGYLSLKRHEHMFIEATMFIKKKTFSGFLFDESFGVGTFHGAEEAYDLVLRMLRGNVVMYYSPEITVYHPQKVVRHSESSEIRRVFSYRCGFAHLCRKHGLHGKYLSRLLKVIFYIPYTAAAARGKTRYYCAELLGLLAGRIVR